MRKRILGALLCLCMIIVLMPVRVMAAAENIEVTGATYYDSGALKSIDTKFDWHTANATSRLVLMTEKLDNDALTNLGDVYDKGFETFNDVVIYDQSNNSFGILAASEEHQVTSPDEEIEISFEENVIPLDENKLYYVYLWTCWSQWGTPYYYPDNLFCVIRVQDGAVMYSVDENQFDNVVSADTFDVTVTIPVVANMTKTSESGAEIQSDLTTAMKPVIYTAGEDYYFPEDYVVETVNGIMVKRNSDTQITVYGTPSADAEITLTAPTRKPLEKIIFGYAYDVQRSPAYPTKGGIINLSGLDLPVITGRTDRKETNAGSWTLTKAGTYSYIKNTKKGTSNLTGIVNSVASNYGLTGDAIEGIVLHELKDGDTHIAYGVVIVYDDANGYAGFIGDNLSGGAGYLLSKTALSSAVTADATMIVTDFVPTINYSIALNPNSTITFDAVTEGYDAQSAKTVTVTNNGKGATGDLVVTLSGNNADSFTLSKNDITSIPIDDGSNTNNNMDTFTVVPKTGLSAGTYTATVNVSGQNIVTASVDVTFTVNAAAHTCSLTPVAKIDATCTTAGKEAYYHCNVCGKNYEDAQGVKEISEITVWGNISELGHTASAWKYDTDNHWKECTAEGCGVKLDSAAHEFEWKIDKDAAETENGSKHEECKVCGYKKDAVVIPATGSTEEEDTAFEETVESAEVPASTQPPKTGDNGMAGLWIALMFISGFSVVATTVISKKRNSVK